MAMLHRTEHTVNSPPRPRGRPSHDTTLLGQINNDGYEVVGAMAHQLGDLAEIQDTNFLEDQARAFLGAILREQERLLVRLGRPAQDALDLNRRAQRKLALVDVLDAEQGLDKSQTVQQATRRNREAHVAGKRIIAKTEPNTGHRPAVLQEVA